MAGVGEGGQGQGRRRRRPVPSVLRTGCQQAATALLLLLLVLAVPAVAGAAAASSASSEHQQQQNRGLNALTDLPTTYGQYLPPWVTSENYGLTYSQTPSAPSWVDPAQAGINTPGWLKYPGQYAEGLSGELYPDVLSYTPDDWVALQAWVYRACPASICRAADRSFVPDASEEAAKEAAFQAWAGASSMASQPNTGATWLHYGTDHFQWYYLLARAALANGQGQVLKVSSDLSDPTFQVLRNANGKWHRDSLKGMMDTPPGAVHMGMLRFGANQQMQDSLRAQARAFDYAYGGVAALSPFPANIQRYRGYYSRQLQQQQQQQPEPEQAAAPLSPQAQQLQEERQQAAGLEAGTTGFTGAATAPSLLQQQQQQQEQQGAGEETGLWGGRGRRKRQRQSRLRHEKKRARTVAAAATRHERRQKRKHHEHPHQPEVNGTTAAPGAAAERREHRHEARRERRRAKRREKKQLLKKQGLAPTVPTAVLLRAPEGNKGGLLYPVATFVHKKTTVKEALARMAQRQAEVVAPVIPPGPIGHAPPLPRPMTLKPVVPAYYHGQTQYAKPHRAFPLVLSRPQHLHPKLAAHFGMGPGGPPLDYEHSGMCKNWCPGRRRLHQAEDKAQRWTYVYLGYGEPQQERVGVEGDKGMLFHKHTEHKKMPKVTKLIPIDRPAEYYAPPKPTILKPVHRVYAQPEPSVFVIVPRKKVHPWLAKFQGYGHGHPFAGR